MAQCTKCGSYTKYENGLCYDCYSEKESVKDEAGLSDRAYSKHYSMIKGRVADTLVEELFLSMGFRVFRYGMENTIPGIMELLKGVRSDVADDIRRMPDFVVEKGKNIYFIEVKFRASEQFSFKDLPKNYPYENAYIVLISKKHIKCITVPELQSGKEITPTCKNYLGNRKELDLDKDKIRDFCDFAVTFFQGV